MNDERLGNTVRFVVVGRVQGVWFRAYTRDRALEIGVRGWVRNLYDGSVVCLAAGDEQQLRRLRQALERGSPASRVERVDEQRVPATEELSGFEIRH